MEHQATLEILVREKLNGALRVAEPLSGGHSGYVYRVEVENANGPMELCIKLTSWFEEQAYDALPTGERVYGTRPSNFAGAYKVLQGIDIAVPTLHASGIITANEGPNGSGYFYQIMDLLDGSDVRAFLAWKTHDDIDALHRLVGETLGRLHQVTRAYDGWVAQTTPYATDWKTAFFNSFQVVIQRACGINETMRANRSKFDSFVRLYESRWIPSTEFVFSHVDGFQGMAKYVNESWHLTGIVDIEDHSFTDARFVLAGHELSLRFEERETPDSFWAGYQTFKVVPDSYTALRNFFQLYYLLDWLPGCHSDWRGKPGEQERVIRYFEELILKTCVT